MARIIALQHADLSMTLPSGQMIVFVAAVVDGSYKGVLDTEDEEAIEYCSLRPSLFSIDGREKQTISSKDAGSVAEVLGGEPVLPPNPEWTAKISPEQYLRRYPHGPKAARAQRILDAADN